MRPEELEDLSTVEEVCKCLRVSRITLYKWAKSNYLKPIVIGDKKRKMLRYKKQDILKLTSNDNILLD